MRTNLSEDMIQYIKDLEEEVIRHPEFADEIITVDDQLMTVRQAIELNKTNDLSARNYNARQTNVK